MIRLTENKIVIEALTIEDPDIVSMVSTTQGDDERTLAEARKDLIIRAMKIGALALQRAQTRVDVEVVRTEFVTLQQQVTQALDEVFREDNGRMALALQKYLGEGGKLEDLFDPQRKESAISRIQAIFDDHFAGDGARFVKLLDYTEDVSPLRKLQKAFEEQF
jgi:hypothetical protein